MDYAKLMASTATEEEKKAAEEAGTSGSGLYDYDAAKED